ncbi:MAG: peptide chain release factor N(5)-glutamine methyltransferase [Patescibacteria group bacterium]|jgi:release factor glutamine methyltransferase
MRVKNKISPLEKDLILAHILNKSREWVLTYPKIKLSPARQRKLDSFIERRLKGEPLAYILGHKEFYGLDIIVNNNVLVPRPETELMVDEVLNLTIHNSQPITRNQKPKTNNNTIIIDVGTGSGCIAITLAKLINHNSFLSSADHPLFINHHSVFTFLATDISRPALSVAKKNAKLHGVEKKIKFFRGNLLEPILKSKILNLKSKIIITANLPYGWKAWKNNCSQDSIGLKFEPPVALYTGKNGLQLYEKLLKQITVLASSYKKNITCFFEFDPRQTIILKKIIKKYLPDARLEIKKDLKGHNRLLILHLSEKTLIEN